jgi:hypothetical protein
MQQQDGQLKLPRRLRLHVACRGSHLLCSAATAAQGAQVGGPHVVQSCNMPTALDVCWPAMCALLPC